MMRAASTSPADIELADASIGSQSWLQVIGQLAMFSDAQQPCCAARDTGFLLNRPVTRMLIVTDRLTLVVRRERILE